jgi:predicted metal-dependent peptidase
MSGRAQAGVGDFLARLVAEPEFLQKYPYYAAILASMNAVADPSVERMAVSLHEGRFYLHVNVDAFVREPMYLAGVLLHEVHHVALGHLTHPKFKDVAVPELMDLAIEMSANEHIEEPLPDPITWRPYALMGLRAGQSTMERYDRLLEAHRGGAITREGSAAREARAGALTRTGGGVSLREAENLLHRREKAGPPPGDATKKRVDDHRFLRRMPPRGAVERTRELLEDSIATAKRLRPDLDEPDAPGQLLAGKQPGRLVEELTGSVAQAEAFIDWKTALRMFVTRERAPVHTYARPSRRFPAMVGRIPGRAWSPRRIERPKLVVALDTSLSMTGDELAEVARQLAVVAEMARLVIVECDTEVTRVYPFAGTLTDVAGRGGTDLRPVFASPLVEAERPDGIVYFTDGNGPFPNAAPALPVLWILTKPGAFGCPFGARAELVRKASPPKRAKLS